MAIQYDVMMAVKPISVPKLQLTNTDSSHSDFQCDINYFRYVSRGNHNLEHVKNIVIWVVMPCSLVDVYSCCW
jgi:hypothetical protein